MYLNALNRLCLGPIGSRNPSISFSWDDTNSVDHVRNLISATKTRSTEEFNTTGIRTIRFGGLGPISNLNNDSDEEKIKEDIDSAGYSVGV
jgi:hypothetical protein